MKNYYKVLGVPEQAQEQEIKAAYRKLAKKYHPDVVKGDKAKEGRMYEIQEAYQCLADRDKRKEYDQTRTKVQDRFNSRTPQRETHPDGGHPNPDMGRFEQFFGFQPGKGMETYRGRKEGARKPDGPVKPEEMFSSFFGGPGRKGGGQ